MPTHGGDRSVQGAEHVGHGDLGRGPGQSVPALGPALAQHQPGAAQLGEDALEELHRDPLQRGELLGGHQLVRAAGQLGQRTRAVVDARRDLHAPIQPSGPAAGLARDRPRRTATMGARGCGGIGRRAGFRFLCPRTCGFKSRHPHGRWSGTGSGGNAAHEPGVPALSGNAREVSLLSWVRGLPIAHALRTARMAPAAGVETGGLVCVPGPNAPTTGRIRQGSCARRCPSRSQGAGGLAQRAELASNSASRGQDADVPGLHVAGSPSSSASTGANARKAWPRWLIASFSAASISAVVRDEP